MLYGVPLDDVWDVDKVNNSDKTNTGFPTQKPLDLYGRLVQTSSREGDTVLDPFCGCATTCVELIARIGSGWASTSGTRRTLRLLTG